VAGRALDAHGWNLGFAGFVPPLAESGSSNAGENEKGIFGRAALWVDASGTIDGREVGVTVIDLPGNPRKPFIHARDYGLVLANAFGRNAYGVKKPQRPLRLELDETLRLQPGGGAILVGEAARGGFRGLASSCDGSRGRCSKT
jgi:hypothetical protein